VFGGAELPVPVESIAGDLLGLSVEEDELDVSGLLLPAQRRVFLNVAESPQRRRFTLAHAVAALQLRPRRTACVKTAN
jgi:hypothetical protein